MAVLWEVDVYVRSADGTRLYVETGGPDQAPVVVLVPGLGSTRSWRSISARLSEEHRVVAYDLRGHGRSGRPTTHDYSMAAHAEDLDAVLASMLDDGDSAGVVGYGLGGEVLLGQVAGSLQANSAPCLRGRPLAPGCLVGRRQLEQPLLVSLSHCHQRSTSAVVALVAEHYGQTGPPGLFSITRGGTRTPGP